VIERAFKLGRGGVDKHPAPRSHIRASVRCQHGMRALCLRLCCLHPLVLDSTRDPDICASAALECLQCTPHLLTHTRLHLKTHESGVSAVAGAGRRGRQRHGARGEAACRGASVDKLIIGVGCVDSISLPRIVPGQRVAGLHKAAPAASDPPYPLLHALPHARARIHAHALGATTHNRRHGPRAGRDREACLHRGQGRVVDGPDRRRARSVATLGTSNALDLPAGIECLNSITAKWTDIAFLVRIPICAFGRQTNGAR
jgi:hypothetical protein